MSSLQQVTTFVTVRQGRCDRVVLFLQLSKAQKMHFIHQMQEALRWKVKITWDWLFSCPAMGWHKSEEQKQEIKRASQRRHDLTLHWAPKLVQVFIHSSTLDTGVHLWTFSRWLGECLAAAQKQAGTHVPAESHGQNVGAHRSLWGTSSERGQDDNNGVPIPSAAAVFTHTKH